MAEIYLASRSPRRRQLLDQLQINYACLGVDINEIWNGVESPQNYVTRLALEKARAGLKIAKTKLPVLAADTEVVINNEILGKPRDSNEAVSMLLKLSDKTHHVFTAIALVSEREQIELNINKVSFKPLTREECEAYCKTKEPFDKAGAYAIQGRAAAFVNRLEGSFSGVMGLPLTNTAKLLQRVFKKIDC